MKHRFWLFASFLLLLMVVLLSPNPLSRELALFGMVTVGLILYRPAARLQVKPQLVHFQQGYDERPDYKPNMGRGCANDRRTIFAPRSRT